MPKLEWEEIETDNVNENDIVTWRARVPGGWLVTTWALRSGERASGKPIDGGSNWGGGATFVPDSDHRWHVDIKTPTRRQP